MKKLLLFILCSWAVITGECYAQQDVLSKCYPDSIKAPASYEHVHMVRLYGDTLVTSFIIFIKDEVKVHYHDEHSEHVYILEGSGVMTLGKRSFNVKKGDFIFIPMQQSHSLKVTSPKPMKVLSIQAPYFDGKDRYFIK